MYLFWPTIIQYLPLNMISYLFLMVIKHKSFICNFWYFFEQICGTRVELSTSITIKAMQTQNLRESVRGEVFLEIDCILSIKQK